MGGRKKIKRLTTGLKGWLFLTLVTGATSLLYAAGAGQAKQAVTPSSPQNLPPASSSMAFSDVVKYALEHNAAIAASRTSIDVARAGRETARAQRLPVIGAGGSLFGTSVAQPPLFFFKGTGVASSMGMGMFTTPFLATSYLTYAGTLSLPLYTGGRISNQVRIGDVATQIAETA
jgi:outer membrane protein TolC